MLCYYNNKCAAVPMETFILIEIQRTSQLYCNMRCVCVKEKKLNAPVDWDSFCLESRESFQSIFRLKYLGVAFLFYFKSIFQWDLDALAYRHFGQPVIKRLVICDHRMIELMQLTCNVI